MPLIMPLDRLTNADEISKIAHSEREPIFITQNGYSDLVVMSSELYEDMNNTNRIDKAIYESELEMSNGGRSESLDEVFERLNKKYYG
jgi:PHD/YefM family antitoxin component YafN of YafNO toxin-antitoxin module